MLKAFIFLNSLLPSEVSESLVGLCHLLGVIALLDSDTFVVVCGHQFCGETLVHRLALSCAGCVDDPAECECLLAFWANFARNLVVCSTNAAGADFDCRTDVADRAFKDFDWLFDRHLFLDDIKCSVHDLARSFLLAADHDIVDELFEALRTEFDIWLWNIAFLDWSSHRLLLGSCLWLLVTVERA